LAAKGLVLSVKKSTQFHTATSAISAVSWINACENKKDCI